MTEEDKTIKVVRLNEGGRDLLDATYYCKVDKCEKMNVVIKLKASDNIGSSPTPQRYVLLMDVSASMNEKVKGDDRSLLERIKVFGHLFVSKVTPDTSVAIVTFSDRGEIVLPMTKMDSDGKQSAHDVIDGLQTIMSTNISDGLFTALAAIQDGKMSPTRDCIILFTDGQANKGITEPEALVREFKFRVKNMGRSNEIPVSAYTIGDNDPFFLNQVSAGLGSDSFYWLNVDCDFEADMLLPLLIRDAPSITDVELKISCQNGVKFQDDRVKPPTLLTSSNDIDRTYFIHIIPQDMNKNIMFSLILPKDGQDDLHGKMIVEVWKSFLDNSLTRHSSVDFLELRFTPMRQLLYEAYNISDPNGINQLGNTVVGPDALDYLENTSSYVTADNQTNMSWKDAQESMVKVLGQQCRMETISAISSSAELVNRGLENEAKDQFNDAISEIKKMEDITEKVLGKNNPHCKTMKESAKEDFRDKLEFLTTEISNVNPGRLTAMASSFSTEMPTASGVFETDKKQPFMPEYVEKHHGSYKQIVSEITQKSKDGGSSVLPLLLQKMDELSTEEESVDSVPGTPDGYDRVPDKIEEPAPPQIVYMEKFSKTVNSLNSKQEEIGYDADSLFLASILPDIQQLSAEKKLELKLDILKLLQNVLYKN